jgi:hypothetical protein
MQAKDCAPPASAATISSVTAIEVCVEVPSPITANHSCQGPLIKEQKRHHYSERQSVFCAVCTNSYYSDSTLTIVAASIGEVLGCRV